MKPTARRLAAAGIAVALIALVICDLSLRGFRVWWDDRALSASIVSSLLVLGVTALIVDEVVARRQRSDRANSVAVQAVIVYDQAQRTCSAVLTTLDEPGEGEDDDAPEELRALAGMLLTSSANLFDDPEARLFLEDVQRLTGVMFRASSSSLIGHAGKPSRESITIAMDRLHASATPLIRRLSAGYRAAIDEPG
jgi:hypothetical protein